MELNRAVKTLLAVGLPSLGTHSYLFSQNLLGMMYPTNCAMQSIFVIGFEIGRARNMIAYKALEMGAKYLLFWDDDVIAPGFGVERLLWHLQTHPNWGVVGGVYSTKAYPAEPLIYTESGVGPYWDWQDGEMVKVLYSGLGFHLIRCDVLREIWEAAPTYIDQDPVTGQELTIHKVFETYTGGQGNIKEGHTEDYPFYRAMADAGYEAWIDTSIACGHYDNRTQHLFYAPNHGMPKPWDGERLVVNLGAGKTYDPYEINVDLQDQPGIYRADIRKLPEDWANKFDKAKSHHTLEHFSFRETDDILAEWVRILKPGTGELEIHVPDMQWAAEQIVNGVNDTLIYGVIWGDQGHGYWNQDPYGEVRGDGKYLPWSYENNSHKTGFTAAWLSKKMMAAGLTDLTGERQAFELRMTGRKLSDEEAADRGRNELPDGDAGEGPAGSGDGDGGGVLLGAALPAEPVLPGGDAGGGGALSGDGEAEPGAGNTSVLIGNDAGRLRAPASAAGRKANHPGGVDGLRAAG